MLIVISHPRSGSTYFMSRLRRFRSIRAYMEIFHFNDSTIVQALGRDADRVLACIGADALPRTDRQVRGQIFADVDRYLDCLDAVDASTTPVFKVFPHHLPPPSFGTLVRRSQAVLLLTRNPLHAYVSWEVARGLNRYGGVDTSGEKVDFSEDAFRSFTRDCMAHLALGRRLAQLHRTACATVSYEDLMAAASKDAFIGDVLGQLCPDLPLDLREDSIEPRKQDSRSDITAKVSNPDMLLAFVSQLGLEDQLRANAPMDWERWSAAIGGVTG